MKSLKGRVALVTGAANGIGKAIATVLAQEGAAVAVLDLDGDAARRAAEALTDAGADAIALTADVVDRAAMTNAVQHVIDRHARLDILAANAGIFPIASLDELGDDEWDRVMAVNAKGTLHAIQACVAPMRAHGYGRIVMTSSITGPTVGAANLSAYAASKAAQLGLMRSAALELVADGITVNAVQPGNVLTDGIVSFGEAFIEEMARAIPMRRLAEPIEVGWAVRYLVSDEAAYVTGQTIVVDGGQTLPEGGSAAGT